MKNDVYPKKFVRLEDAPFFNLMESLKYFLNQDEKEKYAKAQITCMDQHYGFKIEKEDSLLLFSEFAKWEKWDPVKIRSEGIEKEIQCSCRQFLKDYGKRCPMLLKFAQIYSIKPHFGI